MEPTQKKTKYKMTFEVTCKFDDLIDEKTFHEEYNGNLRKLVDYMIENEGTVGWYDEELELTDVKFLP